MTRLKTSVLIVNYNYEKYVGEAIQSVLEQSQAVDQLIVVDDGSTDNSRDAIKKALNDHPDSTVIHKENGGQASCYQTAIPSLSGDIIFCLDSDDRWQTNHIASFMEVFEKHPEVDFVFSGLDYFGHSNEQLLPYNSPRFLGMSPLAAIYNKAFVGSSPSAIAMRKETLAKVFPLEEISYLKKYYADEIFVRATSIQGAVKYYQYPPSTDYRTHDNNGYHGRKFSAVQKCRTALAQSELINYFRAQTKINELCCYEYHKEFMTNPTPDKSDYKDALKTLGRLPIPFNSRLRIRLKIWRHYQKNGLKSR